MKTNKALIVDGNPLVRENIHKLLKNNYRCETARNLVEALALSKLEKYDLAILEINPQSPTDAEMVYQIRNTLPGLKVLGIMRKLTKSDLEATRNIMVDTVILKPFTSSFLLQKIRQLHSIPTEKLIELHTTQLPFNVEITIKDSFTVLRLMGKMVKKETIRFKTILETLLKKGTTKILMDLLELKDIDFNGFQLIKNLGKRLRKISGKLKLCGVQKLFSKFKIDEATRNLFSLNIDYELPLVNLGQTGSRMIYPRK